MMVLTLLCLFLLLLLKVFFFFFFFFFYSVGASDNISGTGCTQNIVKYSDTFRVRHERCVLVSPGETRSKRLRVAVGASCCI